MSSDDGRPEAQPTATVCPSCHHVTDSLKVYDVVNLGFLFIWVSVERETLVACLRCMRWRLLQWGGLQVISANLIWPLMVLPTLVFRLVTTLRRGGTKLERQTASGFLNVAVALDGFVIFIFCVAVWFGSSTRSLPFWPGLVAGGLYVLLLLVALVFNI
jgi:hypothetical protein